MDDSRPVGVADVGVAAAAAVVVVVVVVDPREVFTFCELILIGLFVIFLLSGVEPSMFVVFKLS
jgi:hypothetical protein